MKENRRKKDDTTKLQKEHAVTLTQMETEAILLGRLSDFGCLVQESWLGQVTSEI